MALVQSRKFLRDMAQPFEQSGKSLWGIEELQEKQRGDSGDRGHDHDHDQEGMEEEDRYDQRPDQPQDVKMEEVGGEEDYFNDDMDQAGLEEMQRAEREALNGGGEGVEAY